MNSHDASAQMLGYMYQVRCALDLLLSAENEQSRVCIERFDDIAFSDDGDTPDICIQTKHHVNSRGDLTDASVDLWRTLNVWLNLLHKQDISNMRFTILTTSNAPENSAAYFIRCMDRNPSHAYEILKSVAKQSASAKNKGYYELFLTTAKESVLVLLNNVTIIDGNKCVLNVVDSIKKSIRYSSRPEYEEKVYERIEGWWFKKTIEALCSYEPIFISQEQIRSLINDVSSEYAQENLPIDTELTEDIDIESFPDSERVFCEQLRLIDVKSARMKTSIRDYYRAFIHRNNWIKDELLYIDELERYEERLVDEWQHLFARMQDDVDANDETEKQKAGRTLLGNIEDKNIRIRDKCSDTFVMRGSYHMLANRLKVGWHLDFLQRLESLLKEERASS